MDNNSKIIQSIKNDIPKTGSLKLVLVGITALVVFVEAAFLVYFVPKILPEITSNTANIESTTTEVVGLERAVSVLDTTSDQDLAMDLVTSEKALPSEKSVTGLVSALSNLATSSAAEVNQIQISFGKVSSESGEIVPQTTEITDVKLANQVVGVPLTMNLTATDLQALDVVSKIQQALPLLGINKFAYIVSGDKKNANLSVLIYSQAPDKFSLSKVAQITPLTPSEQQALSGLGVKTNILQ